MWNHIINIHPSKLLSTKTKNFRINELLKKGGGGSQYPKLRINKRNF